MASSASLPMAGCLAFAWRCAQRDSFGTQKTFSAVFVSVLGVRAGAVTLTGDQLCAVLLAGVGNVLEEDQPEDNVLVFSGVHVAAQLVGREPKFRFEAEGSGGVFGADGFPGFRHEVFLSTAAAERRAERLCRAARVSPRYVSSSSSKIPAFAKLSILARSSFGEAGLFSPFAEG